MQEQIKNVLCDFNFDQIGFAPVTKPVSLSFYKSWLDQGLGADMTYLKDHYQQKTDLSQLLPEAKSIIVVTKKYLPHPKPAKKISLTIANYAKGEDYHYFFKSELDLAIKKLELIYPGEHFFSATDSKPILERDFAYQAGLGWFGKNTCLIHEKKGSFFLIGEIITTLSSNEKVIPHPDRCGTCTKCIDACPTQALDGKSLDSNKCISFWTIESKKVPEIKFAKKFQDWFFGCDVCQNVCPWNQKIFDKDLIKDNKPVNREETLKDILNILKSSNKSLEKLFSGTPLSRARGFGLKRNALIIAMNMNALEIKDELFHIDLKNKDLEEFKTKVLCEIS